MLHLSSRAAVFGLLVAAVACRQKPPRPADSAFAALQTRGAAAMGATRMEQLRYVMFPHMVTAVFTGLRLAMTLTLLGVLLAELFVSQGGIGFFTLMYAETFNPAALTGSQAWLAPLSVLTPRFVKIGAQIDF